MQTLISIHRSSTGSGHSFYKQIAESNGFPQNHMEEGSFKRTLSSMNSHQVNGYNSYGRI